ncbi:kinetochore Sim4 complex subunit FTA2-domain-containing protein [Chaetomium fimeti]|uniref:Kinetochore Sim4 complex subunit FTA2-domain-containing protein n=1 Tax=Chaetomium fimeti TaxID=1854472 RepID=A0AAE0HBC8_9PEZI|nr:kinetochore Sim4 complex subunit FTA2-domain-containing protein [Chaetomium fimeti]
MSQRTRGLIPSESLPQVPGPKLVPFTPTARAAIQFIKELGDPSSDKDGRVWEVRINRSGPHYALKMFYFTTAAFIIDQTAAGELEYELASPQLYVDYFDAFSCECRAYGRLKEEGREDLAVPAHGYLFLTPKQEARITTKIVGCITESELDGDLWRRSEETRHLPIRAIVKELATDFVPFRPSDVTGMWGGLQDFHRLGILVRDVTVFNYMGGKLVDLSRAWTWPHPALTYYDDAAVEDERWLDSHYLRKIIIEFCWGERWDWDLDEIPEELTDCALKRSNVDTYVADPRQYDWLKWEQNPAEADRFLAENCFRGITVAGDIGMTGAWMGRNNLKAESEMNRWWLSFPWYIGRYV